MKKETFKYKAKDKELLEFLIKNLSFFEFCRLLKESKNHRKTATARLNWMKKTLKTK